MKAAELGGRNSIEFRESFFSPSTQSIPETFKCLVNKCKDEGREKEGVPGAPTRKGSPTIRSRATICNSPGGSTFATLPSTEGKSRPTSEIGGDEGAEMSPSAPKIEFLSSLFLFSLYESRVGSQ